MVEGLLNRWCVKSDFVKGRTANSIRNTTDVAASACAIRDRSTGQIFLVCKVPSFSLPLRTFIEWMRYSGIVPYDDFAHTYHHLPTYNFSKN